MPKEVQKLLGGTLPYTDLQINNPLDHSILLKLPPPYQTLDVTRSVRLEFETRANPPKRAGLADEGATEEDGTRRCQNHDVETDSPSPPTLKSAAPPASLFKSGIATQDIWNAYGSFPPGTRGGLSPHQRPLGFPFITTIQPATASSYTQRRTSVEPRSIVKISVLTQVPPDLLFLARGHAHGLCTGTSAQEGAVPFQASPPLVISRVSISSLPGLCLTPFPHYSI